MFMSFSRDEFTLSEQNSVTDVSVGFQAPCWRLQTKLCKVNIFKPGSADVLFVIFDNF